MNYRQIELEWSQVGRLYVGRKGSFSARISMRGNKKTGYVYYVREVLGVRLFLRQSFTDLHAAQTCAERHMNRLAKELLKAMFRRPPVLG